MSKNSQSDYEVLQILKEQFEEEGDNHVLRNIDTPLRDDAFDLSDNQKIEKIEKYFEKIAKCY